METIQTQQKTGFHADALRAWGMIALALGALGRGLIQGRFLGAGSYSPQELLARMNDPETMTLVTVALVMQLLETCAVPIFAFLTVEGFCHTADFGKYLTRVVILAVLAEIPYNLAFSGKVLTVANQNPVFGVALTLITLYFYQRYPGNSIKALGIKLLVTVAAMVWAAMLRIEFGGCLVFLAAVLFAFRKKPMLATLAGATAAMVCSVSNVFFLVSPMTFLLLRNYNGEPGELGRGVKYLAYPAILLAIVVCGWIIL